MLVNDLKCFPIMATIGYPVCFDAMHSIQLRTSMGNISDGQREFIPNLVRAAVACGVNALFMETDNDPDNALSDAITVIDIKYLENILIQAKRIHEVRLELLEKLRNNNIIVSDVMLSPNEIPIIEKHVIIKEALEEMELKNLGVACILNTQNILLCILTDGDIRRMILTVFNILQECCKEIFTPINTIVLASCIVKKYT